MFQSSCFSVFRKKVWLDKQRRFLIRLINIHVYATMNLVDARCLTRFTLSQVFVPQWLYFKYLTLTYYTCRLILRSWVWIHDSIQRKISSSTILITIEKYRDKGCNFLLTFPGFIQTCLELKKKISPLSKPWTLELLQFYTYNTSSILRQIIQGIKQATSLRYRDLLKYRLLGIKYSKEGFTRAARGHENRQTRGWRDSWGEGERPVFSSRGEACPVIYVLSRKAAATSGVANRLYIRRAEGRSRRESAV